MRRGARGPRIPRAQSEAYRVVNERLEALESRNLRLVAEIEKQLTKKLAIGASSPRSRAATNGPTRSGAQMERKSVGFEQLSDIVGSGGLWARWRMLSGGLVTRLAHGAGPLQRLRLDPKQNDYRSIHTTLIGPGKQRVELQIRTGRWMRSPNTARRACALQRRSRLADRMLSRESSAYAWLRRHNRAVGRGFQSGGVPRAHQARAVPRISVLLHPEGQADRVAAARQAIDFAYAVHTDVGNGDVGLQDQRQDRALVSELTNGDEVEVITSTAQVAAAARMESLVPGRQVARWPFSSWPPPVAVRNQYAGLGRRIVERLCSDAKIAFSDEQLQGALPRPRAPRSRRVSRQSASARCGLRRSARQYPDTRRERAAALAQQPNPRAAGSG